VPVLLPQEKKKKKKPPRTEAVTLTCRNGSYEKELREAREKIPLADLGIDIKKVRRAATGAYVFEIAGDSKESKADLLATKLRETLSAKDGVKIARPCKMADLRVRGLDVSVTPKEVRDALASKGQCSPDVIKVGEIRRASNSISIVWARCPLASANAIVEAGGIRVGWTTLRVVMLEERPLQCFTCLEGGHAALYCPSSVD